jgi:hypothetical protein
VSFYAHAAICTSFLYKADVPVVVKCSQNSPKQTNIHFYRPKVSQIIQIFSKLFGIGGKEMAFFVEHPKE